MFSLEACISKLSTPAFTLLVRRIALSLLVLAVSFCLLVGVAPRAEAQSGRLSIQQLGDALTVYGKLGIKCWICKGENKPQRKQEPRPAEAPLPAIA